MGLTSSGLPYPEDTDPVADGADAIRALAEAITAQGIRAMATGTASVPVVGSGAVVAVAIAFPAGRFTTATPIRLVATPTQQRINIGMGTITPTGVTLQCANWTGIATSTGSFLHWVAVQG